jgi:hypothetical protein
LGILNKQQQFPALSLRMSDSLIPLDEEDLSEDFKSGGRYFEISK